MNIKKCLNGIAMVALIPLSYLNASEAVCEGDQCL